MIFYQFIGYVRLSMNKDEKRVRALALSIAAFSLISSVDLAAQTAVGGEEPDASAMLDIQSTDAGVLFPRMTESNRDAIVNPAQSLLLFNTTSGCLEINVGTAEMPTNWKAIACLESTAPTLNSPEEEEGQ